MKKQIIHTGFVVRDRDKSIEFYRDVLGFHVISEYERKGDGIGRVLGYDNVHLKSAILDLEGGHVLELIQYLSPTPLNRKTNERNVIGASHLAIQVDEIEKTLLDLTNYGAKILNQPTEIIPGRKACYLQVPEENWLELVQIN